MNIAIILAAGKSERFGREDKTLIKVFNKSIIEYSLEKFQKFKDIDKILIAASQTNIKAILKLKKLYPKIFKVILGGKTRQESVYLCLKNIAQSTAKNVFVHNAVNPLISINDIKKALDYTKKYGAASAYQSVTDTIKEKTVQNFIKNTLNRGKLIKTQTPQAFDFQLLLKAHKNAKIKKISATDDASLVEKLGEKVKLFKTSEQNFKITYKKDLELFKTLLCHPNHGEDLFLTGIGQDSHRFSINSQGLMLGGYKLKNEPKLEANSDGDVILHSLFNAISSALGEGSISLTADKMLKKDHISDSKKYLEKILHKMTNQNYKINNVSVALEAKKPKFEPIIPSIKKSLSGILNVPISKIGITATSGENLTSFGKGLGIQAICYVSLIKNV